MSIREIAKYVGTNPGNVSRVFNYLESEALIERDVQKRLTYVGWPALLEVWARDYKSIVQKNTQGYFDPRGTDNVMRGLKKGVDNIKFAVSGTFAAAQYAPAAPAALVSVYSPEPESLADALGLYPAETGGNVQIAIASEGSAAYDRTNLFDNITYVAPSQLYVDLLNGSGRNPSEASFLLDWMVANENKWRS